MIRLFCKRCSTRLTTKYEFEHAKYAKNISKNTESIMRKEESGRPKKL